jgi:hypothetical protein
MALSSIYRARIRNFEYVNNIRATTPCADCNTIYHFSIMEFDHVESGTKRGTSKHGGVMWMVKSGYSQKNIDLEIAKCDIVCSNCHAYRTWYRSNLLRGNIDENGVARVDNHKQ